ncbi:hypothetical protein [uncultured Methanobrevibacter sp.]|uniref:hypothetical protein n=1 Tax=uncultured Methanobrevibacter sp. TaxID=253161 RepID=UPI0025D9D08F|nr:hypothetical protein [uncultured Methanobrevibacter sp.]
MTENKRFTVEDDDADIWEDNHFLAVAYNHINAKKITKRLNKLADENEMIRNTINEMYKNERTQLGKSVLKQLLEAIQ